MGFIYIAVLILGLIATGVWWAYEQDKKHPDESVMQVGIALSFLWPLVVGLGTVVAIVCSPVVLGIFIYKYARKSKDEKTA